MGGFYISGEGLSFSSQLKDEDMLYRIWHLKG